MKLERLQNYKEELGKAPHRLWGEILFRMVSEAERSVRGSEKPDELKVRTELEDIRLKFTIALGALETYADETMFVQDEPPSEMAHLAQITLDKIKKVNWLVDNRPKELR